MDSFPRSAGRMLRGCQCPLHRDLALEHMETGHLVLVLLLQPLGSVLVNDIKRKRTCSQSGKAALPTLPGRPSQGAELPVAWVSVRHSPCGGAGTWYLVPGGRERRAHSRGRAPGRWGAGSQQRLGRALGEGLWRGPAPHKTLTWLTSTEP